MKMYVIFVATGRELKIYRELKKRGFNVILPQKNEVGKSGKTFKKVIFPNYLFIKCDMTQEIYCEICRIRNVKYFLGFHVGGVPFLSGREQKNIEKWRQNGI
ncbi:MAG: transcription termination/antitermination NusG family protein [Ruminococcus sp.]|nr:transcription termination/antitermination NusG family protein [Ruminococcus sp.]